MDETLTVRAGFKFQTVANDKTKVAKIREMCWKLFETWIPIDCKICEILQKQ